MKPQTLAIITIMALLIPEAALATEYYADTTIDVSETGEATISGMSNSPALREGSTQDWTHKKGKYWMLNITAPGDFSDFIYTINLPEGAAINYVNAKNPIRIGIEGKRTFIRGTGKDSQLQITVQYSIDPAPRAMEGTTATWLAAGTLSVIAAASLFYIFRKRENKSRAAKAAVAATQGTTEAQPGKTPEKWYNKETLMDRQKDIVTILERHSKPITQKQLEQEIMIPKSSLSRNIDSLSRRGIVIKEERGMTNTLYLAPKKPET